MSKVIYICCRKHADVEKYQQSLSLVLDGLTPDNIIPAEPSVIVDRDLLSVVINPNDAVMEQDAGICLGMIEHEPRWFRPLTGRPKGSYAIFRNNDDVVELISDAVSSRTIWYYIDKNVFIASNSQRAIIRLIGSLEFNKQVLPWLISSGGMGPDNSWDKRIKLVPCDCSVILEKKSWIIKEKQGAVNFNITTKSSSYHYKALSKSIKESMEAYPFNLDHWVLPLSGGFDSRALLCFLMQRPGASALKAVTWGRSSSINEKGNDAYIAKELARHYNLEHSYFTLEKSDVPFQTVLDRFLVAGEGRVDAISGYMDGFALWKQLFEQGIHGVIRGDQVFGSGLVMNDAEVRHSVGLSLCSDFADLGFLDDGSQRIPEELSRQSKETLMQWRDRLIITYRVPVIKSALNDLKFPYVELVNPLMNARIIEVILKMPDHLRDDRKLYKKIVKDIGPAIPFAKTVAIESSKNIFKTPEAVSILKSEIEQTQLLPEKLKQLILSKIKVKDETSPLENKSVFTAIKRMMPVWLKARLRGKLMQPQIDMNQVAFRAYLYIRMHRLLHEDALVLRKSEIEI